MGQQLKRAKLNNRPPIHSVAKDHLGIAYITDFPIWQSTDFGDFSQAIDIVRVQCLFMNNNF